MSYIESLSEPVEADLWDKLFPRQKDSPKTGEFELGLALGGTVSAGAYTAGVLDFLVEALDNWEAEKADNPKAPSWKITIKTMSGTSGGGVLAATLAKALSWEFPHVASRPLAPAVNNPFYHVWVESLDIKHLLSNGDLKKSGKLQSLLNSDCRFRAADYVARFPQTALNPKIRNYVANPLPIFLTLTNLKGIPYTVDWGNGLSQAYTNHADYVRMAIFTHGGNAPVREDELGISTNPLAGYISWETASQFALGSSAFPMGLPLQPLSRPVDHYRYRPVVIPGDGARPAEIRPQLVDWETLIPNGQTDVDPTYHFLAADGGTLNNEPIELCRRELAGMVGRNPREGEDAYRAVILIDPFADAPHLGSEKFTGLGDAVKSLLGGLISQARYDTQDILLASHPECYSRFMITAKRGNIIGGRAIATASLGAFGGFLCQEYREHDYFLGRKNCQDFLANPDNFWLPETNPLFEDWRSNNPAEANTLRRENAAGVYCLPAIPLFGSCLNNQTVPAYPSGQFDPDAKWFQDLLENRVDGIIDNFQNEITSFPARIYAEIGEHGGGKSFLIKKITEKIREGLSDWRL